MNRLFIIIWVTICVVLCVGCSDYHRKYGYNRKDMREENERMIDSHSSSIDYGRSKDKDGEFDMTRDSRLDNTDSVERRYRKKGRHVRKGQKERLGHQYRQRGSRKSRTKYTHGHHMNPWSEPFGHRSSEREFEFPPGRKDYREEVHAGHRNGRKEEFGVKNDRKDHRKQDFRRKHGRKDHLNKEFGVEKGRKKQRKQEYTHKTSRTESQERLGMKNGRKTHQQQQFGHNNGGMEGQLLAGHAMPPMSNQFGFGDEIGEWEKQENAKPNGFYSRFNADWFNRKSFRRPWEDPFLSWSHSPFLHPRFRNFFGRWRGVEVQPNWWDGPNVCTTRSEKVQNDTRNGMWISRHFSIRTHICDASDAAFKCTTRTEEMGEIREEVIVKECCDGFLRRKGTIGCTASLPLKNLTDTARKHNLSEFLRAAQSVGLKEDLNLRNYTIFAPVNAAMKKHTDLMMPSDERTIKEIPLTNIVLVSPSKVDQLVLDMRHLVLGHIVPGVYKMSSLVDEQLLRTANPLESTVRINFYEHPEKKTTVNCIPVIKSDVVATNGVIHIIEDVLSPVTDTITDLVSKNPSLTYTKKMLSKTRWSSKLRGPGQFTFFAPTDSAFRKMKAADRTRLFKQPSCLKKVLKHVLLPNVICSTVIKGEARTKNVLGYNLNLTRQFEDKLFVDGAQVVARDKMATNGVLYYIDKIVVPDDAVDMIDVAEKNGASMFRRLMDKSGLTETLRDAENVTFFAPNNEALKALGEAQLQRLESNPDALKSFVRYHFVASSINPLDFFTRSTFPTLDTNHSIHITQYEQYNGLFSNKDTLTAQCSVIVKRDLPSCTAKVYILDKVMSPPNGSIMDILQLDSRFKTFVTLLKNYSISQSLTGRGTYTVVAPTETAFRDLDQNYLKNPRRVRHLLKSHIIRGHLCCAGISKNRWVWTQSVRTLSSFSLRLSRDDKNVPALGDVSIRSCDTMATNGIVHVVDRLVIPHRRMRPIF